MKTTIKRGCFVDEDGKVTIMWEYNDPDLQDITLPRDPQSQEAMVDLDPQGDFEPGLDMESLYESVRAGVLRLRQVGGQWQLMELLDKEEASLGERKHAVQEKIERLAKDFN